MQHQSWWCMGTWNFYTPDLVWFSELCMFATAILTYIALPTSRNIIFTPKTYLSVDFIIWNYFSWKTVLGVVEFSVGLYRSVLDCVLGVWFCELNYITEMPAISHLPWMKWEATLQEEGRIEYNNDYSQLEIEGRNKLLTNVTLVVGESTCYLVAEQFDNVICNLMLARCILSACILIRTYVSILWLVISAMAILPS